MLCHRRLALVKGQRYGTIICDLGRNRVIDLKVGAYTDREAAGLDACRRRSPLLAGYEHHLIGVGQDRLKLGVVSA